MTTYYVQQSSVPSASSTYVPVQYVAALNCPSSSGYLNKDSELNELIEEHYQINRIQPEKIQAVENMLNHLHSLLDYNEELGGSEVEVFGSLRNGLGSNGGDVDMSLRWPHSDKLEKLEKVSILQKLLPVLYDVDCFEVQTVFGARVPIIKYNYFDVETRIVLECDISINNELALKNTALIHQYCSWEPRRLPRLAGYVKKWAKDHNIGSAASGTLSSYVYSLMLIQYLQVCSPPVLPRLQEEFRSSADKPELVDGCDTYFAKIVMPGWTMNRMSVAELFKGFLAYYSSFDFQTTAVQIRSRLPLLKVTRSWTSPLAIEDPFIHSYNLGGYSREAPRILKTFNKSSEVFNTSFEVYRKELQMAYRQVHQADYFGSLQQLLTDKIEDLLTDKTVIQQGYKKCSSLRALKRPAGSPIVSPRYEKQPLWIPPDAEPIPIPCNMFYDDNLYNYHY